MKVLQINKYLKIVGGAETYMFQLSKLLESEGAEVKYWGMRDEENLVQDFPGLEALNIDYSNQALKAKISSVIGTIYSQENRIKIAKVLDEYQPDIVHIHNYNFQLTPSILPEIKKRGIKIVQTIHDSQMVCPYHRLYNFKRNEVCTKCVKGSFTNCVKDRCFDDSLIKSTIGAVESIYYHSRGYYEKYIDQYICPSNFLADLIRNKIKKEIKVIPNFTEVTLDKQYIEREKKYYLYYGRISEEKGILELIEIFEEIELKLLIVGKGPLDSIVKEKIENCSNITFLGTKFNSELFSIVKQAKYVIQSAKWFENCPMTIIESFALGVPVIGSNHSGFKDLIIDKQTGFLLDFNNKLEVISKLIEIDKLSVLPLKTEVQKYYERNLSKKIHLEKILSVYKSLLKI